MSAQGVGDTEAVLDALIRDGLAVVVPDESGREKVWLTPEGAADVQRRTGFVAPDENIWRGAR